MTAPPESAELAFRTSAYSFKALAEALVPLMDDGGSLVGMDFDASVAWPIYDWMGVAKAALESVSRYLARDLGEQNVRVNLVSAGPVETPAAQGIPASRRSPGLWEKQAPLGWDTSDPAPVADAVLFLLSDLARGDNRRDPARGRRLPRDGRAAQVVGSRRRIEGGEGSSCAPRLGPVVGNRWRFPHRFPTTAARTPLRCP